MKAAHPAMRNLFIAGNWKMHKTNGEAVALARSLVSALAGMNLKVMIAPAFTALSSVAEVLKSTSILLGAQNMGPQEMGAHTGEVSVLMLKEVGVSVVILGHSERRHLYGEADELINRKVRLALKHGLEAILCVGETLEQRESGVTKRIVEEQLKRGLSGVAAEEMKRLVIAYEPVWAIGSGKTATPRDADEVHAFIRKIVSELYSPSCAQELIIQYGGSVKAENAAELMRMNNIDGLLVGGASLSADSFSRIVKYESLAQI